MMSLCNSLVSLLKLVGTFAIYKPKFLKICFKIAYMQKIAFIALKHQKLPKIAFIAFMVALVITHLHTLIML